METLQQLPKESANLRAGNRGTTTRGLGRLMSHRVVAFSNYLCGNICFCPRRPSCILSSLYRHRIGRRDRILPCYIASFPNLGPVCISQLVFYSCRAGIYLVYHAAARNSTGRTPRANTLADVYYCVRQPHRNATLKFTTRKIHNCRRQWPQLRTSMSRSKKHRLKIKK